MVTFVNCFEGWPHDEQDIESSIFTHLACSERNKAVAIANGRSIEFTRPHSRRSTSLPPAQSLWTSPAATKTNATVTLDHVPATSLSPMPVASPIFCHCVELGGLSITQTDQAKQIVEAEAIARQPRDPVSAELASKLPYATEPHKLRSREPLPQQ